MDDYLTKLIESYASNKLHMHQLERMFHKLDKDLSNSLRDRYIKRFARHKQKVSSIHELLYEFPLSNNLYMFWDCAINNMALYKLGRDNVFSLKSDQFLVNLMRLPVDTYFFDDTFEKSIIITSDFLNNEQKIIVIE